ncbi:MAG TPA: hypothetical protein VND98_07425 [Solirubrobacterales bacterium]|nr:hypothetical protein [Solirubrobacterales bacterium]
MSRIRVSIVFAALLALATVLAACGSSSGSSSENPQKVVNEATLKGVKSGNLDLTLGVKVEGKEGGNVNVSLSGPFQSQGKGQPPELDLSAKVNGSVKGKPVNFEGGLTLLAEKAYVDYKGTEYEVEPTTFNYVKTTIEQDQQKNGAQSKSAGSTACQEAASDLKVGSFIEQLKNEGSTEVAGTGTTHVSGALDIAGAIGALLKLSENPACHSVLGASGQVPSAAALEKAKGQVESAVKAAHVDLYVGSDHILRKITGELEIEPPNRSSGPKKVALTFDLSLSGVNESQTISAPSGAKSLNELFQKLGVNPIELLGAVSGKGGLSGLTKGLGGGSSSGLGSILNGLSASGGGSSSSGASPPSGGVSAAGGSQQAYMKCLQGASTPADLQKCAALLKK